MFTSPNLLTMKSITYGDTTLRGQMRCTIFGHKFKTVPSLPGSHREFECAVCQVRATNDEHPDNMSFDEEFRAINRALISRHRQTISH